jgi:hypothetical protein
MHAPGVGLKKWRVVIAQARGERFPLVFELSEVGDIIDQLNLQEALHAALILPG